MLSKRLRQIAGLVTPGHRLADIGTDHAWLPVALCQEDMIPSAIATDLRSGPLRAAARHIRDAGLEDRIEVRQADGLQGLSAEEADTIVITGMGGRLIRGILEDGAEGLRGIPEWILGPQSETGELRSWLAVHGFRFADERMVEEDGKFYPILRMVPEDGPAERYTETELVAGPCLLRQRDPVLRRWLELRLHTLETILRGLEEQPGERAAERAEELRHERKLLREAEQVYEM